MCDGAALHACDLPRHSFAEPKALTWEVKSLAALVQDRSRDARGRGDRRRGGGAGSASGAAARIDCIVRAAMERDHLKAALAGISVGGRQEVHAWGE